MFVQLHLITTHSITREKLNISTSTISLERLWDCIVSVLDHLDTVEAGLGERSKFKTGKVDSLLLYIKWQTEHRGSHVQERFSLALSSLKQLQTHGQENKNNKKKEAFLLAFSKQQVVCLQGTSFQTTDVKD